MKGTINRKIEFYILGWLYDDVNIKMLGVFNDEKHVIEAMCQHVLYFKNIETKFKYNYSYVVAKAPANKVDLSFNPDDNDLIGYWTYDKEDSLFHDNYDYDKTIDPVLYLKGDAK